jgi:hypothetical protein
MSSTDPIKALEEQHREQKNALKDIYKADEQIRKLEAAIKDLERQRDEAFDALVNTGMKVRDLKRIGVTRRKTAKGPKTTTPQNTTTDTSLPTTESPSY